MPFALRMKNLNVGLVCLLVLLMSSELDAGPLRFVTFNVWGDWVGNYVCERDEQQVKAVLRLKPDILALQEMTPNYWKGRLLGGLTGYGVIGEQADWCNYVPLAYRRDVFELVEGGALRFDASLEYTKGVTWGVFRVRETGAMLIAFSTHFWWKNERPVADDFIRKTNVRDLAAKVAELRKKYQGAPVIGGGDLNSEPDSCVMAEVARLGLTDVQSTFPGASDAVTLHGYPERIPGTASWRGHMPGEGGRPKGALLDHVLYCGPLMPKAYAVDSGEDFRDTSDHFPVVVDFELGNEFKRKE